MNKQDMINYVMRYLYSERQRKITKDFDEVSQGTLVYGNIIQYKETTKVYNSVSNDYPDIILKDDIPKDLLKPLSFIYGLTNEMREMQGVLRWLSNAVNQDSEFAYLICNGTPCASSIKVVEEYEPLLKQYEEQLNKINQAAVKKAMTL